MGNHQKVQLSLKQYRKKDKVDCLKVNNPLEPEKSSNCPLVSIGIPTFNGEKFIAGSIESILSQTYKNIEIIISDDCSTDNTFRTLLDYARRDKRISISRNKKNVGTLVNTVRVIELGRGKYFMLASDHDIWESTFVEKCVAFLEANPTAVSCFCLANIIDQDGQVLCKQGAVNYFSSDPEERFSQVMRWDPPCWNLIYSIFRRDDLVSLLPMPSSITYYFDVYLVSKLCWRGKFMILPELLYHQRMNRGINRQSSNLMSGCKHYFNLFPNGKISLPFLNLWVSWLRDINAVPIPLRKKLMLAYKAIACVPRWRAKVAFDVALLLQFATRSHIKWDSILEVVTRFYRILHGGWCRRNGQA